MKTLLIALVAVAGLLQARAAQADCGCAAWLLTEQVVEGRPAIVITAACPGSAPKLVLTDPAGTSVPVKLLSSHKGYGSTQYVFSPDRPVAPGKHAVSISSGALVEKHALAVVGASPTVTPPAWSGTARVLGQKRVEYGCGPANSVVVEAGADASLAFVELVDDRAMQRASGYVKVDRGTLSIGHGMCSGAFSLTKGRTYTATITLLAPERGTSSSSQQVTFRYAP